MKIIKENIIPFVIGSILSGIGALLIGIYSDVLPVILPSLESISTTIYLKISALLILLLVLTSIIAIVLFLKTKSFMPRTLSGKDFGFEWSAELDYRGQREEVDIDLRWLCPTHSIFFHIKSAEVPNTAYNNLFCPKCDRIYEMESGGDIVYVQDAENIVRRKILGQLRING